MLCYMTCLHGGLKYQIFIVLRMQKFLLCVLGLMEFLWIFLTLNFKCHQYLRLVKSLYFVYYSIKQLFDLCRVYYICILGFESHVNVCIYKYSLLCNLKVQTCAIVFSYVLYTLQYYYTIEAVLVTSYIVICKLNYCTC